MSSHLTDADRPATPDVELVPALGHHTLAAARELIGLPSVKVLSTDVFDTLVWRRVREPANAFPVIGQRLRERGLLAEHLEPDVFGNLRRLAEKRVRRRRMDERGESEIRLAEIYAEIPDWVFAGHGSRVQPMQVELDVERELIVPDLDVLELMRSAEEAGKTVIAISDTYFATEHIRYLLGQELLSSLTFRHIFASCEYRENKSGRLFDIALATLGVEPEAVVHIGDNEEADVECARRRGIRTIHVSRRSAELENVLAREASFGGGSVELAALRSKMEHRGELAALPEGLQPYWRFGATVLGPVFTGFAAWVHRRAQAMGVRQVFCLMREGSFLADLLNDAGAYLHSPVTARTMWLNRQLCARAILGSASVEELEQLCWRRTPPTIGQLCDTIGISITDLPEFVSHADTTVEDPITRQLFLEAVVGNPRLRETVRITSRELRERILRYTEATAGPDGPIVVVDLGWGATIQRYLARAYEQAERERTVAGLYLVTHEGAADGVFDGVEVAGFLGNCGVPEPVLRHVLRSPEVLEQVCMPDHGAQIDLTTDFEPVLEEGERITLQRVEADAVRKGIRAFQREWARYAAALGEGRLLTLSQAQYELVPILLRSITMPTDEEVGLFGDWYHDENQGSTRQDALINLALVDRIRHVAPQQLSDLPMDEVYWPMGLARRADPAWTELTQAAVTGQISWDATASTVETGRFRISASRGVGIEGSKPYEEPVRRNRYGLSYAAVTLKASALEEIELRPAERPCLMRIDWLECRVWAQGLADPIVTRMDSPAGFAQLELSDCYALAGNVFRLDGRDARLRLATAKLTDRVVFRVDVECGFAMLPVATMVPAGASSAVPGVAYQRRTSRTVLRGLVKRVPGAQAAARRVRGLRARLRS